MANFTPKPGSFSAYLEYMQRAKEEESSSLPASSSTPATSPFDLLEILGRQVQSALPLPDLQTLSGMDPVRYRDALKLLSSKGYVAIEGDPLDGIVRLTDSGSEVSKLSRPI
jgi:hypothetical protein